MKDEESQKSEVSRQKCGYGESRERVPFCLLPTDFCLLPPPANPAHPDRQILPFDRPNWTALEL